MTLEGEERGKQPRSSLVRGLWNQVLAPHVRIGVWSTPPGSFLEDKMSCSQQHLALQKTEGSSNDRTYFELNSVSFPRKT